MGRFALNKSNINKIGAMLRGQVANVKKELAREAYHYFVNFAYKKDGGGEKENGDGYTLYYLSNWRVGINGFDDTVPPEYRLVENTNGDKMTYPVDRERAIRETAYVFCDDVVSVTNSVDYGVVLNEGGFFDDYYYDGETHPELSFCEPNRFVEQGAAHMIQITNKIIRKVAKECPSI